MKSLNILILLSLLFLGLCFSSGFSQETVEEKSTGKIFPKNISFSYDSVDYELQATGTAVRKKFIFKVYGMVHYMQNAPTGSKEDIFHTILKNNFAKQITLDFDRDVGSDKIKGAFQSSFSKNATEKELQEIQPYIDDFFKYFNSDVKKNDQYIFRWLPDGTVVFIVQGTEPPAITNITFAKTLWKIWLGKDSIVDRDDLINLLIEK